MAQRSKSLFVASLVLVVLLSLRIGANRNVFGEVFLGAFSPAAGWLERRVGAVRTSVSGTDYRYVLAEPQPAQEGRTVVPVARLAVSGVRRGMVLARGSSHGLRAGQSVLIDGFLVGRIVAVEPDSASVRLIEDPEFRAAAVVAGDGGAGGIIKSTASGLVFDLVPEELEEGTPVVTSGLDGIFPPGLPIGVSGGQLPNGTVFRTYQLVLPRSVLGRGEVEVLTGTGL